MAHFAELESKTDPTGFTSDTHLIVKRVVVVGNDISTAAGPLGNNDMHVDGETWCQNFFGGTWKQTSWNANFRKKFAGKGDVYNPTKDRFLDQQPYASWYLNNNDDWTAPVTYPTTEFYDHPTKTYSEGDFIPEGKSIGDAVKCNYWIEWDEDNRKWIAEDSEDSPNDHEWDPSALKWNKV